MIKRNFIIGEEWIYYVIFSSPKGIDTIIVDYLPKMVSYLFRNRLIDKWFFVRYDLPDFQLRLRFHSRNKNSISQIILTLTQYLDQILTAKLSYKIEAGMYNREIERYGNNSIEIIEELFYHDSEFIMNFLRYLENNSRNQDMRWLISLLCIDQCLENFNYTTENKYQIISNLRNSFWKEFGLGRETKKQVDQEYRLQTSKIHILLSTWENHTAENKLWVNFLKNRNVNFQILAEKLCEMNNSKELEMGLEYLLTSIIHMTMNRIFISNNRMNEAICYDFLKRFYKSRIERKT